MGDYALRFNAARIEVEELTEENKRLRDVLEKISSQPKINELDDVLGMEDASDEVDIPGGYDGLVAIAREALTTSEEGGVCEWENFDKVWMSHNHKAAHNNEFADWKYCPYCGKPIRLRDTEALTEEGEE